eukprot:Rhum_TRINITY_DN8125_c0_g1::Rhum_TRINITY_DN8125_c0_g1_i1::g.26179::m.26179/K05544/DUS3; tRNA-dihydrouridine synthase 3
MADPAVVNPTTVEVAPEAAAAAAAEATPATEDKPSDAPKADAEAEVAAPAASDAPAVDAAGSEAEAKPPGICYIKDQYRTTFPEWELIVADVSDKLGAAYKTCPLLPPPPPKAVPEGEAAAEAAAVPDTPVAATVTAVNEDGAAKRACAAPPATAEEAEVAAAAERPSKRGRGQNKGNRKAHTLKFSGDKPEWLGELNFVPTGFSRSMRPVLKTFRARKNWKCALCNGDNNGYYNNFSCVKCNKIITPEVDEATMPKTPIRGRWLKHDTGVPKKDVPAQDPPADLDLSDPASLEPAAAGWYEPRAKKSIDWLNKSYLSPLTTVGNMPFRRICTEQGADITCSEMACADNLLQFQSSEWSLLRRHESEKCYGLQIAASSPSAGASLGKVFAEMNFSYDFIDINCGCPVDCICNKGMGSALTEMRNLSRLRGVLTGLHYQPKPVTIKVRIGRDEKDPTLHKWIKDIKDWGADAITIHGRSRRQRYSRLAHWDYIYSCAEKSPVPVIGNGDLFDYTTWNDRLKSGVQGIMTGRGALIKPWLFTEVKEQRHWDISSSERLEMLKTFTKYGLDHWGADERGRATTRKFLCEWLGFLCRYVPVAMLERLPQAHNERPQPFVGRDDLETLMSSDRASDWVKISEIVLGPCETGFKFIPKHKSSAYTVTRDGRALEMREDGGIALE